MKYQAVAYLEAVKILPMEKGVYSTELHFY